MDDIENRQVEKSVVMPPRSWRRRVQRAIILYVIIPYLAVTLIFFIFQRKLMYQPTVAESLLSTDVGLDPEVVRDVHIQTPDGETLHGWLLKRADNINQSDQNNPLVVYFPGNALNRHQRIEDLREFAACRYDVLIFDYRGFGDSSGSPSEKKLSGDARLIWKYAREELNYAENRIVIFGESLGGAVALSLWAADNGNPPQPAALMLNSTFTSMSKTAAWHYPMFPFGFLVLDRWPSIERIDRVQVPVIVFHGTNDEIVPVSHGRKLAQASAVTMLYEIRGAGHNNIPMHLLRAELIRIRESIPD